MNEHEREGEIDVSYSAGLENRREEPHLENKSSRVYLFTVVQYDMHRLSGLHGPASPVVFNIAPEENEHVCVCGCLPAHVQYACVHTLTLLDKRC